MSWEQLLDIVRSNREEQKYWASIPPQSCPNDGTTLLEGPPSAPGILYCPFDGWQYPRDYRAPMAPP